MRRRLRIEVVESDPAVEQMSVAAQTTTTVLGASFVAAVGVSLSPLAATPLGWLVVGSAAVVGAYPAAVHLRRSRRPGRIAVAELPPPAADVVSEAGRQAQRLRALAEVSPPGPVADHFKHLATTADRYVVALHTSLRQASISDQSSELDEDAARLTAQLRELADAAEELRQAQRVHLETSPLSELTEATRKLTEVINTTRGLDAEIP